MRRILIVNGHPDPRGGHFCDSLVDAYAAGAAQARHELRRIDVAKLDFPWLRSKDDFEHAAPPDTIARAQQALLWAEHVVIVHPLWLGMLPALLKAFLEQLLRPDLVGAPGKPGPLRGKSARLVVTMGMPAVVYRWWFGAHGLKALRRSVLGFCGIAPIAQTLIGRVESAAIRRRALERLRALGAAGR